MSIIFSWKALPNVNLEVSRNSVGAPSLVVGGGEYSTADIFGKQILYQRLRSIRRRIICGRTRPGEVNVIGTVLRFSL